MPLRFELGFLHDCSSSFLCYFLLWMLSSPVRSLRAFCAISVRGLRNSCELSVRFLARIWPGSCQNLARSWPDSGQEAHRKLAGIPSASLRNRTGSSQGSHRPGRTAATKGKSTESSTSNRAEIPVRIAKASHRNLTRCTRTPHHNLTSTAHEAYIELQRICEASAWEPHGISEESVTERQAICKQTGRNP